MSITFTPLQERHFSLLLTWLEAPHVKTWWDQDMHWTIELIKDKYTSYVHGYKIDDGIKKSMQAFIISANDEEIGYTQLYNAHDFARKDGIALDELPRSLAAFDIFIGDPAYVGKGYGSQIMKQFLEEFIDPAYEACLVDPDTANPQAIRAYKNAGFKKIKTVKDGAISWMVRIKP